MRNDREDHVKVQPNESAPVKQDCQDLDKGFNTQQARQVVEC